MRKMNKELRKQIVDILNRDKKKYRTIIELLNDNVVSECEINGSAIILQNEDSRWLHVISENNKDLEKLLPLIKENKLFGETQTKLIDTLSKDKKFLWRADCYKLVYNKRVKLESGIKERTPLRVEDAKIVNEYWPYNSDISFKKIEKRIKIGDSVAIFKDKKPVSWVLTASDNSMGFFHTLKEYRRNGYGEMVTKELMNIIIDNNKTPFVYIKKENEKSMPLVLKLGFDIVDEVSWFEFE